MANLVIVHGITGTAERVSGSIDRLIHDPHLFDPGGTASVIENWRRLGNPVSVFLEVLVELVHDAGL